MFEVTNYLIQLAIGVVVLFTMQMFLREMRSRNAANTHRWLCAFLSVMRWPIVLYLAATTSLALGVSFGFAVVAMLGAMAVQSIYSRRVEESELLDWLTYSVVTGGGSVPDAFDKFAGNRATSIAQRCRRFAHQLRSGTDPTLAAKQCRMPLSVGSLIMIEEGGAVNAQAVKRSLESDVKERASFGFLQDGQFAYFITFFVLINVAVVNVLLFIYLFIMPTLVAIYDEFGINPNHAIALMKRSSWIVDLVARFSLLFYAIFCGIALLGYFWPANLLLNVTPWFGNGIKQRGQYTGLRDIAAGLRSGRSLADSVKQTELKTRSRWGRSRARDAHGLLVSGQPPAVAFYQSGLVNSAESRWMGAANLTGNLAGSLDTIALTSRRRFELLWRIRLSWMIPLSVFCFGLVVLFLFYAILGWLAQLIGGLT